ncbi:HAD family hydrolase [Subtercola lobariae]|uniref:HAD family hydrolase n=1 Tax=Subtercola lobariae TaxID=1588641 RepID=A0A917EWG9_9MICO|nr:HAD family hydrolase [Subtercola lobariae]GGF16237.1 HAD family hydrolase [Subtercola lobariae]
MDVRAIAFDVNGTLIDIRTEDHSDEAFRAVGHLLTYQGIDLRRHEVRELYFGILKEQRRASAEEHPEFDAPGVWRTLVERTGTDFTRALPPEKLAALPELLSECYRGVTRRQLKLYPHTRKVLQRLQERFPLAIVSDAQSSYARGELHKVGIASFFDPIVISGDYGYRKPDARLFQTALDAFGAAGITPEQTLYVGNDMHRDIFGAQQLGMKTVLFASEQGTKSYHHTKPDHTITDLRELLHLVHA